MKSLIIETSTEFALLAVVDDKKILCEVHLNGGPSLSKSLGLEIKKISTTQFDRIVVGVGPGSFTGIRVGVAIAQALSFGWEIPLYTVSSLTGYALDGTDFVIAVDARSGGIYIQEGFYEPRLIPRPEAAQFLTQFTKISSPHPEKLPPVQGLIQTRPNPLLLSQYAQFSETVDLKYLSSLEEKTAMS